VTDIGKAFSAGQTTLNLVAVGYSLGLATSVLYLGALGDRYGRKTMLLLGMGLSIPASLLAGFAPSIGVLFVARLLGGVAAGMAFPTTLALITALCRERLAPNRSRSGRRSAARSPRSARCSPAPCWSTLPGARSSSSPCPSPPSRS
jgi:MFS family permease